MLKNEDHSIINPIVNFCQYCKKKKRITQITTCKCELKVCFECRQPETHKCEFDYQENNKNMLKNTLKIVKKDKLNYM